MAEMSAPLVGLAIFVIGLLFAVVPVMLSAKLLRARRYGFGWALLAILLTFVITILAYFVLGILAAMANLPQFLVSLLLLIISLWAGAFAYSQMLRSNLLRGLSIYLLSTLIQLLLIAAVTAALMFGAGMSMDDLQGQIQEYIDKDKTEMLQNLDLASSTVCECESDGVCAEAALQDYSAMLAVARTQAYYFDIQNTVHTYTNAAEMCERNASAGNERPDESVDNDHSAKGSGIKANEGASSERLIQSVRFVYKPASVQNIHDYKRENVRITTRNGDIQMGRLTIGLGQDVVLEQTTNGGVFAPHISKKDIKKLEVLTREVVTAPQ